MKNYIAFDGNSNTQPLGQEVNALPIELQGQSLNNNGKFNIFVTNLCQRVFGLSYLEPVCCKKRQKSPNQETGLGNKGHLKVMNDTKLVLNKHE